jgi:hypothetical protein
MAIWLLTPLDPNDQNWESSSHCSPVVVRAPNEQKARAVAAEAFDVKTGFRPGHGMRFPPWTRSTLVKAEHIHDSRFEEDGPTALLEPVL